jgi:hypothetical protein
MLNETRVLIQRNGKGCPTCGCRKYQSGAAPEEGIFVVNPRICDTCGSVYVVPLPRWIGFLAYLLGLLMIGLLIMFWNVGAQVRRPLGFLLFMVVAFLACFSGGTWILMGKTGYEGYETDNSEELGD